MQTNSEIDVRKPSILLFIAVTSVQMGGISLGCTLGWSAPAFEDMRRNDSQPQLTDSDEDKYIKSWIGSSMNIGALFGGLLSGVCIELLGRKKTLILLGFPYSAGWILLCVSRSTAPIIIGRVITGLCTGAVLGSLPTYVTEISTPKIRGLLGMALNISVTAGILYVDIFSLFLHWNYTALMGLVPSILLTVSMIFMPESPDWLMNKHGRGSQVTEALRKLRHLDSDIEKELDELEERAKTKKLETGFSINQLKRQDTYKPLLIGMCLLFFQQFSGINAVQFYLTTIFAESGSKLKPEYATLVVNSAMLSATLIGGLLVDRLGRKMLLIGSGLGHMISIGVLGYYYFQNRSLDHNETSVLPIICLVVFVMSFASGYGPVPWIIIPEITPSSVIGFIMSSSSAFAWVFTFIVTKEFDDMQTLAQKYGAFWIFSGISALSVVFAIFLPETKGKSFEEIQRIYYPKVAAIRANKTDENGIDMNANIKPVTTL